MYKSVHISDFFSAPIHNSSRLKAVEGLLPLLCWVCGEENGLENLRAVDIFLYVHYELNTSKSVLVSWYNFYFFEQEMVLCVCVCLYTLYQVSVLKCILTVTPFFPRTPSNFSLLSFKDSK